jgi:hypothetical protein
VLEQQREQRTVISSPRDSSQQIRRARVIRDVSRTDGRGQTSNDPEPPSPCRRVTKGSFKSLSQAAASFAAVSATRAIRFGQQAFNA